MDRLLSRILFAVGMVFILVGAARCQTFDVHATVTNANPPQNLTIVMTGSAKTQRGHVSITGTSGGKQWDLHGKLTAIGVGPSPIFGTIATGYADVLWDDVEYQLCVTAQKMPPFPGTSPPGAVVINAMVGWSLVPYLPGDAPGHPTGLPAWSSEMAAAEAVPAPLNTPGSLPNGLPNGLGLGGFGGFGMGGPMFMPIPVQGTVKVHLPRIFPAK